jgi:hypothetical protein
MNDFFDAAIGAAVDFGPLLLRRRGQDVLRAAGGALRRAQFGFPSITDALAFNGIRHRQVGPAWQEQAAEKRAGVTAARHGRQIVDAAEQVEPRECLRQTERDDRAADAAPGKRNRGARLAVVRGARLRRADAPDRAPARNQLSLVRDVEGAAVVGHVEPSAKPPR